MRSAFLNRTVLMLAVIAAVAAGLVANSQTPQKTSDVKIRQRMGPANGNGMETVLYIKGPRMRSEMAGSYGMTTILQCDLKRTLTIYEKTKTYLVTPTDGTNPNAAMMEGDGGGSGAMTAPAPATTQRGGVVNITQTLTDTGERKEMFGFTARRIKTSMVKTASPDACDKDQKVETDGWYIDFQYAFECPGQVQKHQPMPVRPQPPGCQDEIRTKTIGGARLGFPVLVTTTIYQPDGKTTTSVQEVLELSREPLSAALFEAPEGYRLAKNMQELYGMSAAVSEMPSSQPSNNAETNPSSSTVAASSATNVGPKKAGVVRIGLILPKVQLTSGDTAQAAEALRSTFASYLKAPNVEVVPLSARLPATAAEEARQSECDYVLYLSMTVKKGGGGSMFGRAIGNIAGSAAGHIPGGGSASTGAARSAAIGGVYTTATIASSIKAREEVTLEYRLEAMDRARQGIANTVKAKASSDGEDVLTGLVEKAAGAVVATASQRQ